MVIQGNILDFTGVFAAGVMVGLTPCVYPLAPVTAALIAGANVNGTRRAGILLSLVYVLGLALSYAGLAVAAAVTGKVFGIAQNAPAVLAALTVVFLAGGLIMLEIIPLPVFRLFTTARPRTPWAVFVMGLASGFVVGPCTAPVLGGLLAYVAAKQHVLYGSALLFVFACGMGLFLVLAGAGAGCMAVRLRSGAWMLWIRRAAGAVLLGFSGYYLLRFFGLV